MGTILTQAPVNPWAVMGANLAGNLIGDMLQRSREANQNRKLNALVNEAMNSVNAPAAQNFIAQSQVMPEVYDTDPWAAAMHKSYTPMTQYNIGTADINPLVQAAQQAKPTVQDLRNAITANLGTKRFSMLNPALVEQYMTPYYQGMEQQNQEAKKQAALDAIRNAQGDKERLNEAQIGAAAGYVPDSALRSIQGQYQYENPSAADLYRDRQFDATMNYNRGRDAQQQANFMRNFEAQRYDADRNYGLQERQIANQEEAARYALENPGYSSVFTGDDGGQWVVDRNGNTKKLNTGESNSGGHLTPIEQTKIQYAQSRMSELEKQKQELLKEKAGMIKANITGDSRNTDFIDKRITEIDNDLGAFRDEVNSIYESKRISSSDVNPPFKDDDKESLGHRMLGGGGSISSPFGKRKLSDGTVQDHKGTDFAYPKGTSIKEISGLGNICDLRVIKTNTDRNGGGYGNFVEYGGELDGNKIWIKTAHMDKVNVKAGDSVTDGLELGTVGNTGRVRGKNGGYHLHLECAINGERMSVDDFEEKIAEIISKRHTKQNSNQQITSSDVKPFNDNYLPPVGQTIRK